jgi:DHA1 family bicyclomycin/chloramphenicol resistance-like MFS transporter
MTNASERSRAFAAREPATLVVALALLLGLQPVTTDLYLPALPGLARELGGPLGLAQLTLSALILAFGCSQLVIGPLADRLGRRSVLAGGLVLYAAAAVASAASDSLHMLIACRALQGVGLAAAVVCARAMVRDLYRPAEGARVMSQALTGLGVIALASPVVGGIVAAALGWRAALAVTGLFAAFTLALLLARVPETLAAPNPQALQPGPLLATWGRMLRHPVFIAWTLLITCTYGGLYTYLAGSSFIFIDVLGLSRTGYGMVLAGSSLSYIAGTFWCRRLLARHGLAGAVRRGSLVTMGAGVALAASAALGWAHPLAVALPQAVFAFGHGVHQPCAQAAVAGPFPAHAGTAAALSGFMMSLVAFGIGGWLGVALDGTLLPFLLTMAVACGLTALVGLTLVQRHGEPRRDDFRP